MIGEEMSIFFLKLKESIFHCAVKASFEQQPLSSISEMEFSTQRQSPI